MTDELKNEQADDYNGDGNQGQVVMDLGDFVPETYELRFKINGNPYRFEYEEASVDDVLQSMLMESNVDNEQNHIQKQRKIALDFLKKYCKEGDVRQLEIDLEKVPYSSKRDSLCITRIIAAINLRNKKKGDGEETSQAQK